MNNLIANIVLGVSSILPYKQTQEPLSKKADYIMDARTGKIIQRPLDSYGAALVTDPYTGRETIVYPTKQ